ncbi:MAG: hypothetical protein OEW75_03890 [Cyclobacteriaceae bacterium]|nr:hypothetical protein [Cyclobacteriaceae bacterium]
MLSKTRHTALIFAMVLCCAPLFAQDLDAIGKENPLTVSGGVSVNQMLYAASGIESRRDPYSFYTAGNLNLNLYGWNVPLSFSYSNQQTSFHQPFNQYSMHPTYKWVTGHIGYTSMSFSPYTVNGHIFLGGGVDVEPDGKWKFSALYGRFMKPVELGSTIDYSSLPAYKRMGYGMKASYGDAGNFVDLILFHASDKVSSIGPVPDSLQIFPMENLVASIAAGKTFLENFVLRAELASSALSHDIRAVETDPAALFGRMGLLYTSRTTSSYYKAFKSSFDYRKDAYSIGVGFERIDPQYRTLGAYYFNNDLQNLTLNGSASLLQGKVNLAASGGSQRDNLDDTKMSTMRRMVGSVNVNYVPSQKMNFAASYSSFQTFTNIRSPFLEINELTPYDNLDTLNYTQISKSGNLNAMFMIGSSEERRQNLNLNLSVQEASDKQGGVVQNSGNIFYNGNLSYALSLVPQNLTLSVAFNANINQGELFSTHTLGPTAALSKSLLDKAMRLSFSTSYNTSYANVQRVGAILSNRVNGSFSIKQKHNLNLSMALVNRQSNTETLVQNFTEFTCMLGYGYTFGTK